MSDLVQKRCVPCEGGVAALSREEAEKLKSQLRSDWSLSADGTRLHADYEFKNYYHTTAFVTAVTYVAHREDHHPDIRFGYRSCSITWWTHAVGGLTENDFICAAKVDALCN
ncbi:MAG: 4a-hydroxytetrahydrobiopterin dehydratase [Panacagrimonas sp.]